ncbi:hypothetical protein CSUI_006955 [Cystoisospora suis]|uniref:Uncharacterized protein n=1 Tax=Cystoisospora suis TaxID=483139 RepID=A0A2C6KSN1_9APIC|nr:hypothetical protein CSUI_006955 [Cystoisospora suis]
MKTGQQADGEDLEFPSEDLPQREKDEDGNRSHESVCASHHESHSQTHLASLYPSLPTVAGVLPPSADSREDTSHFASSSSVADDSKDSSHSSAGVAESEAFPSHGIDGQQDGEEVSCPPSPPALRESCSPVDAEGDRRFSSLPEENDVGVAGDKEGCGGTEKKEEGKEDHGCRVQNESEQRGMTRENYDPDGHDGKTCEAVSSSPEEETQQQLAQSSLDYSDCRVSSSSAPPSLQTSSTCPSSPSPPSPPPLPPERLESLDVLSVPCSHVESPATSSSQSSSGSSFPSSSSSFDNIPIISNISLLPPPSSIPQSILPSSLLFSSSSSSSFLSSSFSSRSDARPSSSSTDPHLDPERSSQSLLSSFSAGNLFWRVGKKLSHSGRAAVNVASRAATAAAVVTVGEPMVISERGGETPGGGREQQEEVDGEEEQDLHSPVIRTGIDLPFSSRKTQSAEEEGGVGVNDRGEEEIAQVPSAEEGHIDNRGQSQAGTGRGGAGGGGEEQGGSTGRRREEHEGEDHLRQEIEALREQIRIYHEALASMTSISPCPPVPADSSSTTEEKKPSSCPSLASSSASTPAQPGPVDVPPSASSSSSSASHTSSTSLQRSETTSSSSPSSSGNEDEDEEREKNSFLEFSEFFDRDRLRKHFQEEIIEILSSKAAPAAASAALTATEAVVKEKFRHVTQLRNFNFSLWNIRSDVGSIAAATAVSLYEDESLFSRLLPVLSRLILEMVTAYNEEKRRRRERRREEKEKTDEAKMKKVKTRSKRRKRRKRGGAQEKELTEREGQDRKESREESDMSHRSSRRICEEIQGKRRSEGGDSEEQDEKSLSKYAELKREEEDNRRSRSEVDNLPDTHTGEESTRSSSDSCSSCQACGSALPIGTCRHGSGGGFGKGRNDEEISRLMEKIRKQQGELDQQRDLNERQTKQIVQLTLQLTDLKTEEEERLAEERKKSEEKKEKEEEEKRVYEVLESQRVQLDELTAAVAESFELKCHLQELGKSYSQTRDQLQAVEEELRQAREKIRSHLTRIGELEEELQEKSKTASAENTTTTSLREREQQEGINSSSPSLPHQSSSCLQDERTGEIEPSTEKEEGSANEKETSLPDKENRNSSDDITTRGRTDGDRGEKRDPVEGVKKETRENRDEVSKENKRQGGSGDDVLLLSPFCEKGKGNRIEECSALSQTTAESEEGIEVKQDTVYISKSGKALQPSTREQSLSSALSEKPREDDSLESLGTGKETGKGGEGAEEEKEDRKVSKADKEEELNCSTKKRQTDASNVRLERERERSEEKKIEELEKKIRSLQFELESLHARYLCEEKRQLKQLQNLRHLCTKEKQKREKSEAETQRWMARALERQMLELQGNENPHLYDDGVKGSGERTGSDHDSVLSWQQSMRHIMVNSGVHTPEGTSGEGHRIPGTRGGTLENCVEHERRSRVAEFSGDGSGKMNERSSLRREHERNTERSEHDHNRSFRSPPPVLSDTSIGATGIASPSHPHSTSSARTSTTMSQRHQDNTYMRTTRDTSFPQLIRESQGGGYEEEEYGVKRYTEGAVSFSTSSSLPPKISDEPAPRDFVTPGASDRRFAHEDDETRFRKEIEQLKISQELLQVDVAKKAEIISFLLKKYALREETFRGPPVTYSRSTGWRQLAVAAAEAMIGRGKERGSGGAGGTLEFHEMEKIVEETLLENIRLRTDLATLAEDMERSRKEEQGRGRGEPGENLNPMAPLPLIPNNTTTKDCITNSEHHQYLMECQGKPVSSSGKFLSENSQGQSAHCVRQNNLKTSSHRGVDSTQIGENCTQAKKEDFGRKARSDLLVVAHCSSPVLECRSEGKPENEELKPEPGQKSTGEKQQTNHLIVRNKPSSPSLSDTRSEDAGRSPIQEVVEPLSEVVLFHADA